MDKDEIRAWYEKEISKLPLKELLMDWARSFYGLPPKRHSTAIVVWKPSALVVRRSSNL